ncbi:hypothetical protein NLU13_0154 [Sarocladium strictum]|uniref:CHAT domain-containing protein n=1 Tax=Sarocladium strictum TaxID=5046 RepID=A0AA39LB64_SARSR|nr:hypothetical protein NLU13_0154 [Sarocladium strictum]
MGDQYFQQLTERFAALTVQDQVAQVKRWITGKPHNDSIIPAGRYCRADDFVDTLTPNELKLMNLAYGDNMAQRHIAEFFSRASEGALMKSYQDKDQADALLQRAILLGSLAAYHTPLEVISGTVISMFGRALLVKWQRSPSPELLDETIDIFRKAITFGPENNVYRDVHWIDLGDQLRERYAVSHQNDDFGEASRAFQAALHTNPASAPIVAFAMAKLNREKHTHEGIDEKEALDSYIETLSTALASIPEAFVPADYRQSLSSVHLHVGLALVRRSFLTKDTSDRREAEAAFFKAKGAPKSGKLDNLRACIELAKMKVAEYSGTGTTESMTLAEELLKEALEVEPTSAAVMENLGELYRLRSIRTGSDADIVEAVRLLSQCLEKADAQPTLLLLLRAGHAYASHFKQFGGKNEIDYAIDVLFRATYGDYVPSEGDDVAEARCILTNALIERYQKMEDPDDLDVALSVIEEAHSDDNPGPSKSYCWRIHGKVFFARYQSSSQAADLKEAIQCYEKALKVQDAGSGLYNTYNDLGNALLDRFRLQGDTSSIMAAITTYNTALDDLTSGPWSQDSIAQGMLLHGLANAQMLQFKVSQSLSDIDVSVACYQRCLDATPRNHQVRISRAESLAWALQRRFALSEKLEDAQKSQAVLLEVLDSGLPLRPSSLSNLENLLGTAYLCCWIVDKSKLSYLDLAAAHFRKAIESGCIIPSYIRTATANLSMVYRCKAQYSNDPSGLLLATNLFIKVMQTSGFPEEQGHEREIIFYNMSELVFASVDMLGTDKTKPLFDLFLKMLPFFATFKTFPRHTIAGIYTRAALIRFQMTQQPSDALELMQSAAEEIPGSMVLQSLKRTEQLKVIKGLSTIPSMVIAFSLMAGRSPPSALSLFEASRSVLWGNILASNIDEKNLIMLEPLPKLKSRFEAVRQSLSKHTEGQTLLDASPTAVLSQGSHFSEAMSFSNIVDEIRAQPGFEDFLRLPRDEHSLQAYAAEGPIIVVNGTMFRSDALIITKTGISSLHLPLFTKAVYDEMKVKQATALQVLENDFVKSQGLMEEVLKTLWTTVAEPILDHLGFKGTKGDSDPGKDRVWWLTTGWIGNLPIHAAGDHEAVRSTGAPLSVMDRVVSSYIGNIRAIEHLRSRRAACKTSEAGEKPRALLVQMPTTPHMPHGDLPGAEREVQATQAILDKAGFRTKPLSQPKTGTVLRMGREADLVHFACHGVSSDDDPAESMLRLADWKTRPLSVGELLRAGDWRCQLIYLSACETALNKLRPLEDEGLHLAGGFLMAGAVNVVAGLWRIDDGVSVEFSSGFYGELVASGIGSVDWAGCAVSLRNTAVKMRSKGTPSVLWASMIHLGP